MFKVYIGGNLWKNNVFSLIVLYSDVLFCKEWQFFDWKVHVKEKVRVQKKSFTDSFPSLTTCFFFQGTFIFPLY